MRALSENIFELNKESKFYKDNKEFQDSIPIINNILDEVAQILEVESKEFLYYGSLSFGFKQYTKEYNKYKEDLTKRADRNGVHTFKKSSKYYKEISNKLIEVDKLNKLVNPFDIHHIVGFNNPTATQWIEDRFFVEVKDKDITLKLMSNEDRSGNYEVEPLLEVNYRDYIELYFANKE